MSQPAPSPAPPTTPATTAAPATTASTSATTSDSSHGGVSSCRRRIPAQKFDRHTVCTLCRDRKCDSSTRCSECLDWSLAEMEELVKHRVKLDSKSKRRTDNSSIPTTSTATSGQAVPEPLASAEPASTTPMDVGNF